jgi:hypothetical protein
MDAIWSQKKVFLCSAKNDKFTDIAPQIEDGLDWWQKDIAHLKDKLLSPITQAIQTGAGFVLLDYVKKNRVIYRYASAKERADKEPGLFKFKGGQWGIKKSITTFDGPDVFPISSEDIVYSSDATNLQDALMCGYRFSLRMPEIKARAARKLWNADAVNELGNEDAIDDTKVKRAATKDIELSGTDRDKKEFWKLWVRYDVDEDGEEDDIVIIFNRDKKAIMRAIYNPLFAGFRPIIAIVPMPRPYSLEGDGALEIMESCQVEIDTIHNGRLDRIDMINAPPILTREGSGLENMTYLTPGLNRVTTDSPQEAIFIVPIPDVYPSNTREEEMLVDTMRASVGITPLMLGQQTSERPVARDTFQILQESNKKFKSMIDNIRDDIGMVGQYAIEFFAQYKPRYDYYTADDKSGALQKQTLDFPYEYLRDGMGVELAASTELMNTEARREINLTLYQLLSDYYTKTAGMVQAIINPQVPPDFKKYLLGAMKSGQLLLDQIVGDFGRKDAEALVIDISKTIDLQKAAQAPPPQPPHNMARESLVESLNYKDAPPDIQRQIESAAGFVPSKMGPPVAPPGGPGVPPGGPPQGAPQGGPQQGPPPQMNRPQGPPQRPVMRPGAPPIKGPAMTPNGAPNMHRIPGM